ncbi:9708_t:CDS:10 [Acaulospora morrowiae]|uniref:proteasome endopeptidase complex n=1 Tax=Acaulospora morrowiae TaxID=94023 RepID=A0A9N8ZDI4_9GLOM|nr:9708_t:CDS:10 [Acaulospora morrowiae]
MSKNQKTLNVAEGSLPQRSATPMQKMFSAFSGSLITSLFTTPFDVVKVRLQAQDLPMSNVKLHSPLITCREVLFVARNMPQQYVCLYPHVSNQTPTLGCVTANAATKSRFNGTWDVAVKIVRNEGITSLWKGLSPTLVMSVPTTVIYYVGYDYLRDTLWKWKYSENYSPMIAGFVARTISVTLVSPLELFRTRMQGPEGIHGIRNVIGGVQNLVKTNGVSSLWRGLEPSLLRDVPFSALYWTGYEMIKRNLNNYLKNHNLERRFNESEVAFLSGATSGTICAIITQPFDVAKTVRQVNGNQMKTTNMITMMKDIIQKEGYRGLFKGGSVRTTKIAISCALMISTYEMATNVIPPKGGFSFDNYQRNVALEQKGLALPKAIKTGTTIVGLVYKDGIVLGADTRATEGPIVADKNCEKIHYLAPNMYCCGAGTAADTEYTTALISSQLELHRLTTGRQARVVTAMTMLKQMLFRYQGHIGAHLIVGGYDVTGPNLFTVHAYGSTDKLPYVTMGSGSLAAISIFESRWTKDMERQDAIDLVKDAIEAGIFNDLGSGSNVDVVVLTKEKTEILRNYAKPNERAQKEQSYKYKRGTTAFLKESIRDLVIVTEGEAMDIS